MWGLRFIASAKILSDRTLPYHIKAGAKNDAEGDALLPRLFPEQKVLWYTIEPTSNGFEWQKIPMIFIIKFSQ